MHRKGPLGEPSCGPSRSSASSPAEADPSRFLATSELREAEFRMCALQRGAYFTRTGTSPQALQHSPPPAARYLPRSPVEAGTTRLVQAIWDSGTESCRSNLSLHESLNPRSCPPAALLTSILALC